MPAKNAAPSGDPPFEESLRELEELTEKMESSQLPLSDLLRNYERGSSLLASCERALDTARKKIELTHLPDPDANSAGEDPADVAKTTPSTSQDVRLF